MKLTPTLSAATIALLLTACASRELPQSQNPVTYTCNGGVPSVQASYPDTKTAVITIQTQDSNPTRTLHQTRAASGVRYDNATSTPAKPGTLIWWTKGPEAILYLVVPSTQGPTYLYEKQLANCTSAPTAAPVNPAATPLPPLPRPAR